MMKGKSTVSKAQSHRSFDLLEQLLDLKTVIWGFVWAAFFEYVPKLVLQWWRMLSPGKQYLLIIIPYGLGLVSFFTGIGWLVNNYLGLYIGFFVSLTLFVFLYGFNCKSMTLFRRFEYKYVTVRFLWRDYRTRTCKTCGYYDRRTRDTTKDPGEYYESAYAPCERCGSSDFKFQRLD